MAFKNQSNCSLNMHNTLPNERHFAPKYRIYLATLKLLHLPIDTCTTPEKHFNPPTAVLNYFIYFSLGCFVSKRALF